VTADPTWPVLLLGAGALLLWPGRRGLVAGRIRALRWSLDAAPAAGPPAAAGPTAGRRWLLAGAAGLAAGLLVGGGAGAGVALAVALGGERLLRARRGDDRRGADTALARELPVACDLIAVCLAGGMPVTGVLAAVGEVVPHPLGEHLTGVAALYRLGAAPRQAWAHVPPPLAGLGRILVRAGESGSSVTPALRALAAEGRSFLHADTDAAVRRAGVWVLAPLGLCFLPAFVCLGVAPLVLGIAGDVFG
jgi:pilus assembly protein TadC